MITHPRRTIRSLLTTLLAIATFAPLASAQQGRPNPNLLKQTDAEDWTLRVRVDVQAYYNLRARQMDDVKLELWDIGTAAIVFPLLDRTASSVLNTRRLKSELRFDDRDIGAQRPRELRAFPAETKFGLWEFAAPRNSTLQAREMTLTLEMPVTSYRTEIDEDIANEIDWPADGFPDNLKSAFDPLPYIDYDPNVGIADPYDRRDIERLLKRWTGGRDPKQLRPWTLTKFLAGQIAETYRPNGNGLVFDRKTGMVEGVETQGATLAARNKRGSPIDMALLTVAIMREAGLPARLVVGYDAAEDKGEREDSGLFGNSGGSGTPEIRAWTEVALFDDRDGTITWVPVDTWRLRKKSSRMQRNYWEGPVEFVGTHDELDGVIPFANHLFPPTTVRSYGGSGMPGFWGWFVTPAAPRNAFQTLMFTAYRTAQRADDDR